MLLKSRKSLLIGLIIIIAITINNCASFPDKKLTNIYELEGLSEYKKKPSVYLDVGYYDRTIRYPGSLTIAREFVKPVKRVTEEFNLFSSYTMDAFDRKKMDYSIIITLTSGPPINVVLSGLLSAFTIYLIPIPAKQETVLNATIMNRDGYILRTYKLESYTRTWFGIYMFPFFVFGNTPKKAMNKTVTKLVKHLYQDIVDDKIMLNN